VFTPGADDKKRPVMVYLHGGSFIMGGGASYFFGPNYLIEHDVVLVTFNYRLVSIFFILKTFLIKKFYLKSYRLV
jgi:para-nitrobenzyl esterase